MTHLTSGLSLFAAHLQEKLKMETLLGTVTKKRWGGDEVRGGGDDKEVLGCQEILALLSHNTSTQVRKH